MTRVGVLNAGSGTVKAARYELEEGALRCRARAEVERDRREPLEADPAFEAALERAGLDAGAVDVLAHRVVHGGGRFDAPVRVDAEVERALEALGEIAPLHNPPALRGIRAARARLPGCAMVAVFDTAFHAGRTEASRRYAIPRELADAEGLFRYGFHGIAHASLAESLAEAEGRPLGSVFAVTLQLGSGTSACAVAEGRSVETSMGFTPLEGLPMATRSGDVDPGALLHLLRRGWSADGLEELLNRRSGLLGLGGSADVRALLEAEAAGDARAETALALYVRRLAACVGAYWTLLGGRGALVLGGGVARSTEIRRRLAEALAAWEVALDPERNAAGGPGALGRPGSRGLYVFETQEERLLARAALAHAG